MGITNISAVICADWGKEQNKRAVFVADVAARTVRRIDRTGWSIAALLEAALPWRECGSVLITVDAPLGVPASYLRAASGHLPWGCPRTFPEFLKCVSADPGYLSNIVTSDAWAVERPFFAVPGGDGGLTSFLNAAKRTGVDLYRVIDRFTKAKPVFVKSGIPGSVGSAACALWKELGRCLTVGCEFKLWPFDGDLESLLQNNQIALGEIYPRAAYATALLDDPPASRAPLTVAKTAAPAREAAIRVLLTSNWIRAHDVVVQDVDAAVYNEDDFDACITAAALLRCLLEDTPLSTPRLTDEIAEGGILGTGAINLDLSERTFRWQLGPTADIEASGSSIRNRPRYEGTAQREPIEQTQEDHPVRSRADAALAARLAVLGIAGQTPRDNGSRRTQHLSDQFPCPIPGCDKVFQGSRGGWDSHVGSLRSHPEWYRDLLSPDERKRQFEREFPEFFGQRSHVESNDNLKALAASQDRAARIARRGLRLASQGGTPGLGKR